MNSKKHQEIEDLKPIIKRKHHHPSYYEHVKVLFVEGELDLNNNRVWPKLSVLAKRFKLNQKTLDTHVSEGKWRVLKDQFQLKLEAARQDKRIEILSNEAILFDKKCFDMSNTIIEKLEKKLVAASTVDKEGVIRESSVFILESICRALEKAQKVGRLASGESTSNSRQDLKVTFSQGLDMIRKNLESHPDVLKQLKDQTVDGDANILPDIDLYENDNVYEKLKIKQED